jgi:hypothetical protein
MTVASFPYWVIETDGIGKWVSIETMEMLGEIEKLGQTTRSLHISLQT